MHSPTGDVIMFPPWSSSTILLPLLYSRPMPGLLCHVHNAERCPSCWRVAPPQDKLTLSKHHEEACCCYAHNADMRLIIPGDCCNRPCHVWQSCNAPAWHSTGQGHDKSGPGSASSSGRPGVTDDGMAESASSFKDSTAASKERRASGSAAGNCCIDLLDHLETMQFVCNHERCSVVSFDTCMLLSLS